MTKVHLLRKSLAMGIILFVVGINIISTFAQKMERSSQPLSTGIWLYVGGDGPGNYSRIQDAIDDASPGDTVFVYEGIYYENVWINVTIDLIGENRTTTVIDAGGIGNTVIVYADNVRIREFTLQNSYGYSEVSSGIRLFSSFNTISRNILTNNPGWSDGVRLSGCNNTITDNIMINNGRAGVSSWYSSFNNTIANNIIRNNSYAGITLVSYNEYKNMIINNTFIHNGGLYGILIDGTYNTISKNTFIDNQNGINFGGTCTIISGNIFRNNLGVAIALSGSNNIVSENTITKNSYGIDLGYGCHDNIILNNSITNTGAGLMLHDVSNNTISGNTFVNNQDGIDLTYTSNNIISDNILINNHNGIHFYIYYIHNNSIYHNTLISNIQNAYDENNKNNTWYNASLYEGNYWSDYSGQDLNFDGIGDTPYVIPGGTNQDLYPLMKPDFQRAFIFGIITNLSSQGKCITFDAVETRVIIFFPPSVNTYSSSEKFIIFDKYFPFVGARYIFALCKILT